MGWLAGWLVTHFHHAYLVLLILLLRSHLPATCNVYVVTTYAYVLPPKEEMRSQNNICRITAMRASIHASPPTDRPTVPSFHHPTTPMLSSSSDRANDRKYILLLLPDCRSCTYVRRSVSKGHKEERKKERKTVARPSSLPRPSHSFK